MKSLFDYFILILVRLYINLYVKTTMWFGLKLRGLGFALRIIRQEYIFNIYNLKYWFNPKCAAAYCVMPGGYWNEPETHVFLDSILAKVTGDIDFIDVGASVGEMAIPMAAHKKVRQVTAFEPQPQCALSIKKSAQLNNLTNILVVPCAVSEKSGMINFAATLNNPTAASVSSFNESPESHNVPCVTIDETIAPKNYNQTIILIDVEGHEPSVLRGAIKLINTLHPLIIFEYNNTSKKYFSLDDIRNILPAAYKFYRLRPDGDGRLDNDLINTWNCVAVSANTEFVEICADLITH